MVIVSRETINFLNHKNVSRETIFYLQMYQKYLEQWQRKINLISASTLSEIWTRHFADSLQLVSHIPKEKISLIDLGSGAGFPGLVLAIARKESLNVTLVEADLRKCLFLENVSRETISVKILRGRIEALEKIEKQDVITARALAPLTILLDYAFPLMKENSICLFPKGKGVNTEIKEATKKWDFDLEIFPSITDSTGSILKLKNVTKVFSHA